MPGTVLDAIGNTPIAELRNVPPPGCARIVAKLECGNPTGSMKDRMARAAIGAAVCDQLRNRDAINGYLAMGEEIWTQTGGRVDAFVHSVSTGHSILGTAHGLREHKPGRSVSLRPRPLRPQLTHNPYKEPAMAESVYKVIELVGTSPESWEKAAAAAIKRAGKTLRDLRVAEISQLDMQLKDGKVESYRAKLKVSFKYEGD